MRLSEFASLDGALFRVTEASDPKEGYDSARCYVPVALRKQVIWTMHSSAFGAHRDETATHKELVVRYYWPRMDVDVHTGLQEASRSRVCPTPGRNAGGRSRGLPDPLPCAGIVSHRT